MVAHVHARNIEFVPQDVSAATEDDKPARRTLCGAVEANVELLHAVVHEVNLVVGHQPGRPDRPQVSHTSACYGTRSQHTAS